MTFTGAGAPRRSGAGGPSKEGMTMSVNILGLTGGTVLALGCYLIDMMMRMPALG